MDSIHSFHRSTALGPSGLRACHLQELCPKNLAGNPLSRALARLCRMGCLGDLLQDAAPILCCATLIPLKKANGGGRPIAIGEVLRRLIGKTLLQKPRQKPNYPT